MRLLLQATFFLNLVLSITSDPYNLHGNHGEFKSGHFPKYYDNDLNETWTITVPGGFKVVLCFTFFDLENSFDQFPCSQDYVEIFDGDVASNRTSGKLCGSSALHPDDAPKLHSEEFSTTGSVMTVRFITDYSNDLPDSDTPKGFQAMYKSVDMDECKELIQRFAHAEYPEKVKKCDHYCHNFLGSYSCSCSEGYILHSNGYTCIGYCSNRHVVASSGLISSPGYPNAYPKLTDCDWTIEAEVGQVIELTINETFAIEKHYSGSCPYDWIKIDDGAQGSFKQCGTTVPQRKMVSVGNIVKIEFHSDLVAEMAGFQILYRSRGVFCPAPAPPTHGRVLETYGVKDGHLPFDAVVVFECESGFEMKGVHKITCLKDGTFDDDIPVCVDK